MRKLGPIGFPCVWVPKHPLPALPIRIYEVLCHPEGADTPAAHDRRRKSNYDAAGLNFRTGGRKWTFDVLYKSRRAMVAKYAAVVVSSR